MDGKPLSPLKEDKHRQVGKERESLANSARDTVFAVGGWLGTGGVNGGG